MVAKVTSQAVRRKATLKVKRKLRRLQKARKLKRHVVVAMKEIESRKHASARKRSRDIEDDWLLDRKMVAENEADDDVLPLDMIDADIDWENSAFASKIRRMEEAEKEAALEDAESKVRKFAGALGDNVRELLPIKLGSRVVRQTRLKDESDSNEEDVQTKTEANEGRNDDLSHLSAAELLKIRHERLEEVKNKISSLSYAVLADPQNEVRKLKELYLMCIGDNIFPLARETAMKLATASFAEVLVDIIPGYAIRPHTEEEMTQKLKKETKKLFDFEQTLLRYYLKYLQHVEKYAGKLLKPSNERKGEQMSILCLKCLSRLLVSAPHFNYAPNIISLVVRIATSDCTEAVDICCSSLGELFHSDLSFRVSANGAKSIASIVNQKKGNVPPSLVATFLKLNIREVNKADKNQQREKLLKKKRKLNKEKKMKSKQKFAKQMKKLEEDLKEAEATESLSTKLSFATETMNHVFATYFRVINRLPTTNLLEPVLEGLAKFAHLINVEFFDDMVSALASLVNQQHLRLVDSLRCIFTVFIMLSGEGEALNIDPSRFYWSMYRLLPSLVFEKHSGNASILSLMLHTLDLMINSRRKQVPVGRVAAFVKRLLAVAFCMPSTGAAAILLCIRSFFITYPKLICMVEDTDGTSYMESFKPDIDDPDCCCALSSSVTAESEIFSKHPSKIIRMIALHIRYGLPSSGPYRLLPGYSVKAYEWFEQNKHLETVEQAPYFMNQIIAFAKEQKTQLTSKNLQYLTSKWIERSVRVQA